MTNRIDSTFARLQTQRRKAFVAYITAGDPHLEVTPSLVFALERAGADVIELGIPFSDPLADGTVNQQAAQRALEAGTTVAKLLDTVEHIRHHSQVPLVLFTYLNPIYKFGLDAFAQRAAEVGADGVLLLDLPPEERLLNAEGLQQQLRRISLIAPTTPPARVKTLAQAASGFIYYVSREGVTGMQSELSTGVPARVREIRQWTQVPICVGFGISTPEQAATVAKDADGVIVGSALVRQIGQWGNCPDLAEKVEALARPFAGAIHDVPA